MTERFLKYFGAKDGQDAEVEADNELTIIELTEMEIEAVVQELATEHADTDKYTTQVQNLKTLTEAFEKMAKAEAELDKAKLETIQATAKKGVDWGVLGPKVAGVVVYGAVTMLFVAIEREHPPAMRIVQAANTLLNPRV